MKDSKPDTVGKIEKRKGGKSNKHALIYTDK
jgi:hypothetical protein